MSDKIHYFNGAGKTEEGGRGREIERIKSLEGGDSGGCGCSVCLT